MAGPISETRSLNALLTTTLAHYEKNLQDNVFDNYPFLSWANGKLGMARRGSSIKRTLSGGESIYEHILYSMNSTANSYSGYDAMDTTAQDGMTLANFAWKQYYATIAISGMEMFQNQGETRMIDLLQAKYDQAYNSLRDKLSRDFYSDGTDNGSKAVTGLAALVSATATVGGISPTSNAYWAAYVDSSAPSMASTGRAAMRTAFNTVSFGNIKPDAIFTDQTTYENFDATFETGTRYTDTTSANTGFANLTFYGCPVYFDRDCTSGYMYFLNSEALKLNVAAGHDLVIKPMLEGIQQDAYVAKVLFYGNLSTSERRKLGVIQGITA